jgi:hypothetical protein
MDEGDGVAEEGVAAPGEAEVVADVVGGGWRASSR